MNRVMKHLFVLAIRDVVSLESNKAKGQLENVETGEEISFNSALELMTLLERITAQPEVPAGLEPLIDA